MNTFADKIYDRFETLKETSLSKRRFKYKEIESLIINKNKAVFDISKAGESYEKRSIYLIKAGKGEQKILLWSQMHGNEPTATQSIFDILNFIEKPGIFKSEQSLILENCSLYFIPLLNPDGCERFTRRNAQGIDINRDALRLEAPESKILMTVRDEINADYGFNLHDQDIWYAAGNTNKPASLSFLTPSFNEAKDINESRKRSMQLIASVNRLLQNYIPGQTARYKDDFMPTAFGDNIQSKGTSTILIESGGYYKDPEKQYIRKLNTVSILHALFMISNKMHLNESTKSYFNIPFNEKNKLFDYILRNVRIKGKHGTFSADIGIRSEAGVDSDTFEVADIGDLSQYFGYLEKDMQQYELKNVVIGDDAVSLIEKFT